MKKATITFGRMNPPTVGHEKLVDKVIAVARKTQSQPRVYLSHTQNAKKDPLRYAQKIRNAKAAFGNIVKQSNQKNIVGIMQSLEKEGVEEVTMVVGSDRVSDFRTFLSKYNGKDYNFKKITVVSAGARDPDASGVEGMSASKMRALAADGKEKEFADGAPSGLSAAQKKTLYKDVRRGMNIREEIEALEEAMNDKDLEKYIKKAKYTDLDPSDDDVVLAKHIFQDEEDLDDEEELDEAPLNFQQRQKIAMRMKRLAPRMKRLRAIKKKRMATPARLQYRARKAALNILRRRAAGSRGEKYASLSRTDKINIDRQLQNRYKGPALRKLVDRFAKRMMPAVRRKEMERLKKARSTKKEEIDIRFESFITEREDKDIGDRKGNQPAKYHTGLKKSTKVKRDAQFQKQASMDDSDPSAYKKAPGDSAKTKTSKYTKKYKQMYGESADAEFESFIEESSALDRLKKFDKSRQAAGKKPIFTPNKPTEYVKMKKPGLMTTMNVPHHEIDKYKKKGYNVHKEDVDTEFDSKFNKLFSMMCFDEYNTPSSSIARSNAEPREIIPSVFAASDDDPTDAASKKSKVDILLRLGLVPRADIQKYRRALRNRDTALKNPDLRNKLNTLLDKLLDFSTSDAAVYQKLRKSVTKEDIERRADVRMVKVKLPDGRVIFKKDRKEIKVGDVEKDKEQDQDEAVNPALAAKHDREREQLKLKHAREKGAANVRAVRQANLKDDVNLEEKALEGLKKKSEKSGIPYGILKQVYNRGMAAWKTGHRPGASQQQWAYARVNSFLTGGKTRTTADADLWAKAKGRKVKKESLDESFSPGISDTMYAMDFEEHRVQGGYEHHPSVIEQIKKRKKENRDE